MNSHSPSGFGYWYGPDDRPDPPGAILQALRDYRAAEVAARRSTRDALGMGETDLLALRHLLRAQAGGERVGPKDLSRVLGITTASTTSLIDRLVASGHVRREPHATDRRSLVIVPTVVSDSEVRATLGDDAQQEDGCGGRAERRRSPDRHQFPPAHERRAYRALVEAGSPQA